jgi:hypothetical protein
VVSSGWLVCISAPWGDGRTFRHTRTLPPQPSPDLLARDALAPRVGKVRGRCPAVTVRDGSALVDSAL